MLDVAAEAELAYKDLERQREAQRRWRDANREKVNASARARRMADPEKFQDVQHRWRDANRDQINERARARRAADPEKRREADRARRAANPDNAREAGRRWRVANPDKQREAGRRWRAANPDKVREWDRARSDRKRRYRAANPEKFRAAGMRQRHGPQIDEWFAQQWASTGGRCYLHEGPITPDDAVVDHDHSCCPEGRSCSYCRRGLACGACNSLIGYGLDDPARLRLIADNLEAVLEVVRKQIATKPIQTELPVA